MNAKKKERIWESSVFLLGLPPLAIWWNIFPLSVAKTMVLATWLIFSLMSLPLGKVRPGTAANGLRRIHWINIILGTVIGILGQVAFFFIVEPDSLIWKTEIIGLSAVIIIITGIRGRSLRDGRLTWGYGIGMGIGTICLAGVGTAAVALLGQAAIMLTPRFRRSFN